jgi:hypothetical protein
MSAKWPLSTSYPTIHIWLLLPMLLAPLPPFQNLHGIVEEKRFFLL